MLNTRTFSTRGNTRTVLYVFHMNLKRTFLMRAVLRALNIWKSYVLRMENETH